MTNYLEYDPDYVTPPFETLREVLSDANMNRLDLAGMLNVSPFAADMVLDGRTSIDNMIADKLSVGLGIPSEFWLERQHQYDISQGDLPGGNSIIVSGSAHGCIVPPSSASCGECGKTKIKRSSNLPSPDDWV
jgi:plasmid maintenance system antidote protein VapI